MGGALPTSADLIALESLAGQTPNPATHPNVFGWFMIASKFVDTIKKNWPVKN